MHEHPFDSILSLADTMGQHSKLSLKALGAYRLIQALDYGAGATFRTLNASHKGGTTILRNALDELEAAKLIHRRVVRDESGQHRSTYYDFFRDDDGKPYGTFLDSDLVEQ